MDLSYFKSENMTIEDLPLASTISTYDNIQKNKKLRVQTEKSCNADVKSLQDVFERKIIEDPNFEERFGVVRRAKNMAS